MNQDRLFDFSDDVDEIPPNLPLVMWGVRPEAVMGGAFFIPDYQTNQVIKIPIWQSFDI